MAIMITIKMTRRFRHETGEALQERADLNRRIEQLRNRLENSALVQEGERPAEAPEVLLEELEHCAARLEELMVRINLTNSRTMVDGLTLTELIAEKGLPCP